MKTVTFEGFVASLKNLQHNFPKMRGGVKGRLELFRKFIRFGGGRHPLEGEEKDQTEEEGITPPLPPVWQYNDKFAQFTLSSS